MTEKALTDFARKQLTPHAVETFTAVNAWREIARLEAILGLPVGNPIYHMRKSKERLKELNTMLAEKRPDLVNPPRVPTLEERAGITPAAAPVSLAAAPAAPTTPDGRPTASLTEFYRMDATTRTQFAADGGALAKSDFDKLTLSAKSKFCVAGGKILDDTPANFRNRCTAAVSFGSNS